MKRRWALKISGNKIHLDPYGRPDPPDCVICEYGARLCAKIKKPDLMFVGPYSSAGIKFPSQSFLYFSNCNKGDVKNLRKKITQCPDGRPVLPAIELFATMAHGFAPDGTETKWQARTAVRACNPVILNHKWFG